MSTPDISILMLCGAVILIASAGISALLKIERLEEQIRETNRRVSRLKEHNGK